MPLYGWDQSHFDAPDARKAVSEGFSFITHKAGGDKDDAEIGAWWNLMKPYGLAAKPDGALLGAYWVQYPGNPVGRADAFITRLDSQCPGWRDGPFILQVDCEKWNGDASTMPSRNEIEAFCDRLQNRAPKLNPIVYAPAWAYKDTLTGLSYPLWASRYVSGAGTASSLYPGDTSAYWGAYSGQTPEILQFSSSATIAGQTTCDANAYRGTLDQLVALLAPGWEPDVNLTDKVGSKAYPGRTVGQLLNDVEGLRDYLIGDPTGIPYSGVSTTSPIYKMAQVPAQITALGNSLTAAIQALAAKDVVDEHALAAALTEGVAAAVAAALPDWQTPIPPDELKQVIAAVLADAFGRPAAAHARPETLADVDERTRQQREAWQQRFQADGS